MSGSTSVSASDDVGSVASQVARAAAPDGRRRAASAATVKAKPSTTAQPKTSGVTPDGANVKGPPCRALGTAAVTRASTHAAKSSPARCRGAGGRQPERARGALGRRGRGSGRCASRGHPPAAKPRELLGGYLFERELEAIRMVGGGALARSGRAPRPEGLRATLLGVEPRHVGVVRRRASMRVPEQAGGARDVHGHEPSRAVADKSA